MQKILLFIAILLISSCSAFVAGQLSEDHKELYKYNANHAFYKANYDKNNNSIPQY